MGLNLSRNLLLENANNRFTIPEYKKSYVQPYFDQSYIMEIISEAKDSLRAIDYELLEMSKSDFDIVLNEGERINKVKDVITGIINAVIGALKQAWKIISEALKKIARNIKSKFQNKRPKEIEKLPISKYMDILNAELSENNYNIIIADINPTNYLIDPNFPKTRLNSMNRMEFVMDPLNGIMSNITKHTMDDLNVDAANVEAIKEKLADFKAETAKELFGSFPYTEVSLTNSADIIKKEAFGDTSPIKQDLTIGLFQQAMENIKYGQTNEIYNQVDDMASQTNKGYADILTVLKKIGELVKQRQNDHVYSAGPYKNQAELMASISSTISGVASMVMDGINAHMILMTYKCQRLTQLFVNDPTNCSIAIVRYCDNLVMKYLKSHDNIFDASHEAAQEKIFEDGILESFNMELAMAKEIYNESVFDSVFYPVIMEADDNNNQNTNNSQNTGNNQQNNNQQQNQNNAQNTNQNNNTTQQKEGVGTKIKNLLNKIAQALTNLWNKFRDRIGQFVQLDAAWWKKNRAAAVSLDVSKVKVNQWYNYDIDKFTKDTYIKWNPQDDTFDSDENMKKAIYNAIGGTPTADDNAKKKKKVKSLYYSKYINNDGENSGVEFSQTGLKKESMTQFIDEFVKGFNGGILGELRKEMDQINNDMKAVQRNYDNLAKQYAKNAPQNTEKNNQDQAQKADNAQATPQNASTIDPNMTYMKYLSETAMSSKDRNKLPDSEFGLPKQRRFPLNDEKHVLLAIKFFNHVEPEYESELAKNIIKKIKAYDMADKVHVGDKNRFKPYWEKSGLAKKALTEMEELFSFNLADTLGLYDVQREADIQVNDELKDQVSQTGANGNNEIDAKIKRCFDYNSKALGAKMTQGVAAYKQYIAFYKAILGGPKKNKNNNQQNQNTNNQQQQNQQNNNNNQNADQAQNNNNQK